MLRKEVIGGGMSCPSSWESFVSLEFDCMNQVWELRAIVDEERGQMIALGRLVVID